MPIHKPSDQPRPLAVFSQASLQDYLDCRRRFYLRYRLRLAWPAVEAEPVEEHERETELGAAFHRLIQQHVAGVPAGQLTAMVKEGDLAGWWQAYLDFAGPDLSGIRPADGARFFPELSLSTPLAGGRLLAKYDLLVVQPDGQVTIYDWKTSRRMPDRSRLAARMQTRVYRYVLAQAGASLNQGQAVPPERIRMIYWFATFPTQAELFPYDQQQLAQDGQALEGLISEVQKLREEEFYLTSDERRCRFCTYRSLCERGIKAGDLDDDLELDAGEEKAVGEDTDLDFDQVAEIGF